jgi:hypothetical protein
MLTVAVTGWSISTTDGDAYTPATRSAGPLPRMWKLAETVSRGPTTDTLTLAPEKETVADAVTFTVPTAAVAPARTAGTVQVALLDP